MSPASRSKSKDKRAAKEAPKPSPKSSSHANASGGIPTSGYNPLLGTFHTLDSAPGSYSAHNIVNGRFRNIDDVDDPIGNSFGNVEYDSISNNGSWSGESEDHKEKTSHPAPKQETIPSAENDKREKIRQKNEKKHQRQKERRAQDLHEKCSGFLMSRKVEALAQQLVAMGFSQERATIALVLNEGKVEESVAWLFEGEEADKQNERKIGGGSNLRIDISEELAHISDLELRYKCSKQDVERSVVACEGDLEKAEETLRAQKQEPPLVPPKLEENGDPPTTNDTKVPIAGSQISTRAPGKTASSTILHQKRDEKDFNYAKVTTTANSLDPQSLKRVQPKIEWAKPPQLIVASDKRWAGAASSPSPSYSLPSPLQATTPHTNMEARYVNVGNELKSLQLGSVREPVTVMQRPQSINSYQIPTSNISSSPPGNAAGWYPSFEPMNPSGLMPHVVGSRSMNSNAVNTNQLYNQLHYHQQQQQQQQHKYVSSNGSLESPGTNMSNSLWNGTGISQSQTLAAASLGLFTGLGTNPPPGPTWNNGRSMPQFDYNNVDWSLNCGSSSSRSVGKWPTTNSYMQNNTHIYDSFSGGVGAKAATTPVLSNGVSIPQRQNGVAVADTTAGGLLEWTSPFEEKDLFSLSRPFVYSSSQ